jgi:hypothetical protein
VAPRPARARRRHSRFASELAEDAASTKVVRKLGLRVRIVDRPFLQPWGAVRPAKWRRQPAARLRRDLFKSLFGLEVLAGIVPALGRRSQPARRPSGHARTAGAGRRLVRGRSVAVLVAGWHLSRRSPLTGSVRDLLLPVLWAAAGWGKTLSGAIRRCASLTGAETHERHRAARNQPTRKDKGTSAIQCLHRQRRPRQFRTIFLSDIHLDGAAARPRS